MEVCGTKRMLGGEWRALGRVLWVVANVVAGDNDNIGWKNSKAEMGWFRGDPWSLFGVIFGVELIVAFIGLHKGLLWPFWHGHGLQRLEQALWDKDLIHHQTNISHPLTKTMPTFTTSQDFTVMDLLLKAKNILQDATSGVRDVWYNGVFVLEDWSVILQDPNNPRPG